MPILKTGSKRVVVNAWTDAAREAATATGKRPVRNASDGKSDKDSTEQGDGLDDPLAAAKQATAEAIQKLEEAEQAAEQDQARNEAKNKTAIAKQSTEKAFNLKNDTPASRKAHNQAAMAHKDAQSAWAKQAGEGAGNDLADRTAAKDQSDAHGEHVKRHEMLSKKVGLAAKSTYNAGSRRVVVTVN